jgi:tetratricopeptide (TPR) repeat protein
VTADAPAPSARYGALAAAERDRIAGDRRTDPRGLRKTLSGDLDCIALNALEREREHRYPTANALALDLEQHLENKPVSANTGSFQYRARKFTRRHRTAVTSGAVIAALLVATSVGATIQARRVSRARAIAVARQGQAEELIGFMLGDLRDKLTTLGRLDLLDAVGDRALGYFAAVPASQLSNEELYRRAQALEQLGEVRMAQGKLSAAADLMRQSLGIASGLAAHDSLNGRWQIGLAHSHFWAGNVDWQLGNVDAALGHFVPFVTISRRLIAHYPDSLGYREELVYALNNIGFAKEAKGDLPGALASYRSAIGINQELANRDPTRTDWQVSLANLQNAQAVALRKIGDLPGALASHDRELALKAAVVAHDTTDRDRQLSLAVGHAYRGELHMLMGDIDGALTDARAAHAIYAALAAHDTSNSMYAYGLAKSDRQIAQLELERGDAASALRGATDDEALTAHLLAASPENPLAASEAVLARTLESRALLAMGNARGAIQSAERAAAAGAAAVRKKPENIERHRAAADAYVALGDARARVGDGSGARDAWTYGLALLDSTALKGAQTEVLAVQAATLLDLGRPNDAEPVVATLEQRGYRRPTFLRLVHERERPPA